MANIELTPDLIEKLRNVANIESLKALISQHKGISLTDDEAKALLEKVKNLKGIPISDDILDGVAGGVFNRRHINRQGSIPRDDRYQSFTPYV